MMQFQQSQLISGEFCSWDGPLELSRVGTRGMGLPGESPFLPFDQSLSAGILRKGLSLGEAALVS